MTTNRPDRLRGGTSSYLPEPTLRNSVRAGGVSISYIPYHSSFYQFPASTLQVADIIRLDIPDITVHIYHNGNGHSRFRRRDGNAEEREEMAFERTRIKITVEHGKVDVRGIQHQFHGDERGQQVASREKAVNTGKHHHRTQYQIIKSTNLDETSDGRKDNATLFYQHRIVESAYVTYGSIHCQLAETNGFTEEDAEKIHHALITLFDNDVSSTRPVGSMNVQRVYWWKHNCKFGQYAPIKVFKTLDIKSEKEYPFFSVTENPLPNLIPDIYIL